MHVMNAVESLKRCRIISPVQMERELACSTTGVPHRLLSPPLRDCQPQGRIGAQEVHIALSE
jgi:hypothetical protein